MMDMEQLASGFLLKDLQSSRTSHMKFVKKEIDCGGKKNVDVVLELKRKFQFTNMNLLRKRKLKSAAEHAWQRSRRSRRRRRSVSV